jgi:hypothetical protein
LVDTTLSVLVYVHPAASAETTQILSREPRQEPRRNIRLIWNGKDRGGSLVPDGDYIVDFSGVESSTGTPLHNERTVTVDVVPPLVGLLDVTPQVFTPTVPGATQNVQVRVRATQSQFGDSLQVYFQKPSRRVPLVLVSPFLGNGDYKALTDSTFVANKTLFPDSTHTFSARVVDLAGNQHVIRGSIDKDLRGPKPVLVHPTPPFGEAQPIFHVRTADSLTGRASDRHRVPTVQLRRFTDPVTSYVAVPIRIGVPDTTTFFSIDFRTSWPTRVSTSSSCGLSIPTESATASCSRTTSIARLPPSHSCSRVLAGQQGVADHGRTGVRFDRLGHSAHGWRRTS